MEDVYKLLNQRLIEIYDLDEGRRNRHGILVRAASLLKEVLNADLAYGAVWTEEDGSVSEAEDPRRSHTTNWPGPGRMGHAVLQTRETRRWSAGDEGGPSQPDLLGRDTLGAWVGAAIGRSDNNPGILVAARETGPFDDEEVKILEMLAAQTTVALANLETFQEVESLSVTDDLTRVYNYRFLKAALQREVERSSRYGQVFSVLMIDVDHLKNFNEKYGHLEGSQLLKQLADILLESSRAIDLVAKYGGDEFLIILPQTNTSGAEVMGNRICEAVAENPFKHCRPGEITISTGVASFPQHGGTMEALLAASDAALFQAKRAGRNRVVSAGAPTRQQDSEAA